MIKKTITYDGYDGKTYSEDFYFNMSQSELTEMELVHYQEPEFTVVNQDGPPTVHTGMAAYLQRTTSSGDGRKIVDLFKNIVKDSYGIRTQDGKSFIKTEAAYQNFAGTLAYDKFFVELVTQPDIAADFIKGLLPANLVAASAEAQATPGFRPGSETLPQSRRDALAEEQTAASPSDAELPTNIENIRAQMRAEIEAEGLAKQANDPWNGVDGLPQS